MKHKRWLALLLAAVLTVTALSVTGFAAFAAEDEAETTTEAGPERGGRSRHGRRENVEAPEGEIGKDAAKEAALSDAGLSADQVEKICAKVAQTEDGAVVYKVRFTYDGQRNSYQIDALSGKLLDKQTEAVEEGGGISHGGHGKLLNKQTETVEEGGEAGHSRHGKGRGGEIIEEPEGTIGKDAAKEAALTDAGLSADQVEKLHAKVSRTEDGAVAYKVRFSFDGQRYSYQIDALSSEILEKSVKDAADGARETKASKDV